MKNKTPFSQQSGLSLVEVLAALVLLGIVMVGIMTVFPQMTLFNDRTDAKLDTMNLARMEMQHLQSTPFELAENTTLQNIYSDSIYQNVSISETATNKIITFSSNGYDFTISINLTRENVSTNEIDANLDSISLHLVTMSIEKNGQKRSETYGYIAQEEDDPN